MIICVRNQFTRKLPVLLRGCRMDIHNRVSVEELTETSLVNRQSGEYNEIKGTCISYVWYFGLLVHQNNKMKRYRVRDKASHKYS